MAMATLSSPPHMTPLRRLIRRRVRRGSRFLEANQHIPEVVAFRQRILEHIEETQHALELASGTHCVLGKLFPGGYDQAIATLHLDTHRNRHGERVHDMDRVVRMGFLAPYDLRYERSESELNHYYSILTEEWMNEITLT